VTAAWDEQKEEAKAESSRKAAIKSKHAQNDFTEEQLVRGTSAGEIRRSWSMRGTAVVGVRVSRGAPRARAHSRPHAPRRKPPLRCCPAYTR
jgi:hypothetical protein